MCTQRQQRMYTTPTAYVHMPNRACAHAQQRMYTMPKSCAHKYQQRVYGTGLASASIDLVHPQRRHSIPPCRVLHRLPALASGPGRADEATFDLRYELCSLHCEPCHYTISTTANSPDFSQYDGVAITVSMQVLLSLSVCKVLLSLSVCRYCYHCQYAKYCYHCHYAGIA
jgi:hypothetical protein